MVWLYVQGLREDWQWVREEACRSIFCKGTGVEIFVFHVNTQCHLLQRWCSKVILTRWLFVWMTTNWFPKPLQCCSLDQWTGWLYQISSIMDKDMIIFLTGIDTYLIRICLSCTWYFCWHYDSWMYWILIHHDDILCNTASVLGIHCTAKNPGNMFIPILFTSLTTIISSLRSNWSDRIIK